MEAVPFGHDLSAFGGKEKGVGGKWDGPEVTLVFLPTTSGNFYGNDCRQKKAANVFTF